MFGLVVHLAKETLLCGDGLLTLVYTRSVIKQGCDGTCIALSAQEVYAWRLSICNESRYHMRPAILKRKSALAENVAVRKGNELADHVRL